MLNEILSVVLIIGLFAIIWWSYLMFMKGAHPEQRAQALLPADFKPDQFHVLADTYVGVEKTRNRIAFVDAKHVRVAAPGEIVSVEPEEESIWGVRHQWLVIGVRDSTVPQYRIWFRFDRGARDGWIQRLKDMCSGTAA
jgi:hypothetical protein